MVLLHYHVVPGLGDDLRPDLEATAVRADPVAPADCDDLALSAALARPRAASHRSGWRPSQPSRAGEVSEKTA